MKNKFQYWGRGYKRKRINSGRKKEISKKDFLDIVRVIRKYQSHFGKKSSSSYACTYRIVNWWPSCVLRITSLHTLLSRDVPCEGYICIYALLCCSASFTVAITQRNHLCFIDKTTRFLLPFPCLCKPQALLFTAKSVGSCFCESRFSHNDFKFVI